VVSIGLSAGAVARIRFAVSCLWEVVASVRVLRDSGSHAVHLPWANRVRARLADAGLAGPGGRTAVAMSAPPWLKPCSPAPDSAPLWSVHK
jgi:hypothetical protein